MKANIPPFYVGQKVVYITGESMPKDSIHIITGVQQLPCGCWCVGIQDHPIEIEIVSINEYYCCGHCYDTFITRSSSLPFGWNPESFRAIEEQPIPLLTFEKIKEKEKEEVLCLN